MQTSSDFEMKKIGLLVKKHSSGFLQQEFALPEECFEEKRFFFRESFFFCYLFWSLSDFFVFFAKFLSQVCQTNDQRAETNKMGKLTWKKLFSLNNFGLWAGKTWIFSKSVRHDSQNRSLHVQMIVFRKFSGSKNICMKVFGHWTETSDFQRKGFLIVFKGAFQVSSATLWEKDDKSEFYVLWLV